MPPGTLWTPPCVGWNSDPGVTQTSLYLLLWLWHVRPMCSTKRGNHVMAGGLQQKSQRRGVWSTLSHTEIPCWWCTHYDTCVRQWCLWMTTGQPSSPTFKIHGSWGTNSRVYWRERDQMQGHWVIFTSRSYRRPFYLVWRCGPWPPAWHRPWGGSTTECRGASRERYQSTSQMGAGATLW